jgi:preprotein translocase SecE subunit
MAEKSAKSKRRIVKNPETFRERAIKAVEASEQPKRTHRVMQAAGRFIGPVFRPVGRGLRAFFGLKAIRLLGRIVFPRYFRNSWAELRLVTWPNWRESRQLTFAVLVFAVVFGAAIAGVDWGLDKVFRQLLLK